MKDSSCDYNEEEKEIFSKTLRTLFTETENVLDKELPFDENINFQISDIIDPIHLNNIKNAPKYYYQKFKIYFVKFFLLDEYFFQLEEKKEEVPIIKNENELNENNLFSQESSTSTQKKDRAKSVEERINSGLKIHVLNSYEKKIKNFSFNNIKNEKIHSKLDINNNYLEDSYRKSKSQFLFNKTVNASSLISSDYKERGSNLQNDSNSVFFSPFYSELISNSLSYEQIQGLKGLGIITEDEKTKEFPEYKFRIIKSYLNLDEKDGISGKAYEEYAKNIFRIMCVIGTKKEVFLENPSNINYSKILDFYLKNFFKESLNIYTPIKKNLCNNIQDGNEIDIVYHLNYKELSNLSKQFKKYFLVDNLMLKSNNDMIKFEDNNEITLFGEISKNIVKQSKKKLTQILNYIKIITIMNAIAKSKFSKSSDYIDICKDYKCSAFSEKIFFIITDGKYEKLKIIIKFIQDLMKYSLSKEIILIKISDFIQINKNIFFFDENIELLNDEIYNTYLIFANLAKNNIKHALLYIGNITNLNYEEIFKNIFLKAEKENKENIDSNKRDKNSEEINTNEEATNSNNKDEKIEDIDSNTGIKGMNKEGINEIKKDLDVNKSILIEPQNIQQNYISLKNQIKKFEEKISDSLNIDSSFFEPILKALKSEIDERIKSSECLLAKHLKYIKFNAFLFLVKGEKNMDSESFINLIYKNKEMKKLKSYFNLKHEMITENKCLELINKVRKFPGQYGKSLMLLACENKFLYSKKLYHIPEEICIILYEAIGNGLKIEFNFDINSFDKLPVKIYVNRLVNKEIKEIKNIFEEKALLLKENLAKKIINDFNFLFNIKNKNTILTKSIAQIILNLYNDGNIKEASKLLEYHNCALDLLENMNGKLDNNKRKEIMEGVELKLKKLIDNAFALNIYNHTFKGISDEVSSYFLKKMEKDLIKSD
jgi:hypothetical protein